MLGRFHILCTLVLFLSTHFAVAEFKTQEIKPASTALHPVRAVPIVASPLVTTTPAADNATEQVIQYAPRAEVLAPGQLFSSRGDGSDRVEESGNSTAGSGAWGVDQTIPNSLEMGANAGYAGKEPLRLVDGCTTAPGKLQFKEITTEGALPTGCDPSVKMSETLSDAIDLNFTRCAKQAAGIYGSIEGAKIYDIGTMSDASHLREKTTSLHSLGLAIDVRAIELGGTVFDVQDKTQTSKDFFEKFRTCWGTAVNGIRGGCLTNSNPGSVGDENSEHANHHIHLSVPYCPQYAHANGIKIATLFQWFMGSFAHATETRVSHPTAPAGASTGAAAGVIASVTPGQTPVEPAKPASKEPTVAADSDAPKYKYQTIKIANGSEALVTYKDTGSEPVALSLRVSVAVKCVGQKGYKQITASPIEGCNFERATYDAAKKVLKVNLLSARRDEKGDQHCDQKRTREVAIKCP